MLFFKLTRISEQDYVKDTGDTNYNAFIQSVLPVNGSIYISFDEKDEDVKIEIDREVLYEVTKTDTELEEIENEQRSSE